MEKYYSKIESKGLPGGPNEQFTYITGVFSSDVFSTEGYKRNSPDKNNPYNIIPSGRITMQDVDFPVYGMDNLGNSQMMYPGNDYKFPGTQVFELPMAQTGLEVKQRRGVRNNPDGSVSSHLMKAEYVDGRGWVAFPTLFQDSKPYADDNQNWVDMSEEEDWMKIYEEAVRRGEVYDFGEDKEAALAFGMGSWKDQLPEHLQDKKYGGIPKGQTGGTIYVDPNDPAGRERYQAYQDSLNLYDEYMDMYNLALNTNAGTREQVARRYNIEQDPTASHLFHLVGTNLGSGKQYMNARNTTDVNPNILPIAARSYADDYNARTSPFLAEYKKPVQPIKYHDPEIVVKQQQLIDAGYDIGGADGIWGPKSQTAWEAYEASPKPVEEDKPTEEIKETETPATTSDSDAEIIGYIRETYYDTDTNSNQTKYRPVKKGEAIPTDGTFVSYKGSAPQYQTGGGTGKSPDDPDYKGVGTAYGNHEPYTPTAEELLSLFTNEVIEPSIEVAGTSTPIINNVTNNPNFPINSNLNFQDPQEYSLPQPPEYEYIQMDDGSFVLVDVKKTPPIVLPVGGVEYKSGGSTSNSFSKWMKNNNLPKAQTGGGTVKVKAAATPKLKKVRATAEDQILTYKDNADWFDSRAVYSGNPQYDDLIKKRVYSGNYGYNPATGAVVPLNTRPAAVKIEDNILTYKDNSDWFDGHAKYHDDPAYDESIRKAVYSGKWGYNPATQMLYPLKKEDQVEISDEVKNILDLQQEEIDERDRVGTMSPEAQEADRKRKIASQLRAENRQPITIDEIGSRSNPLLREEDKTGRRPWEGKEGQTLFLTPEETSAYYKDWVAKSNVAMGENPLFYAPGVIAGAAFAPAALAGLGEATYGALAPAFSAPATIAGTTIPVATAGNLINAGFAGHGLYNVFPDAIDFATNPSWEGAGNLAIDALEIAPIARAAGRGTVEGYNTAKQVANKLGNKYLPNAYKYNPKVLKETPEVIMYRTQKPGQTEELMELKKLQQKRDTEGISSLSPKEKVNLIKFESRPGFGQGFDTEVARIGYYGNPNIRNTRSYQEIPEVLRVKVPREQAAGYNVSNFPDYRKISTSPRTEHLLPYKLIESAEKLSFDDYARLVQEDKVFNTPHWLTGYGSKTPKQLPGSPNTLTNNVPKSITELSNTGFKKDPYYHYQRFLNKIEEVTKAINTPEGRKRIQGYIDRNPHLQNKTVDDIISDFEKTKFEIEAPKLDPVTNYLKRDDSGNIINFPVNPENAYNWYREGYDNPSFISMGQNYTPYDAMHVLEHEFGHLFQRGQDIKGVDDVLGSITLKNDKNLNAKTVKDFFNQYNPFAKKVNDAGYSVTGDVYGTSKNNLFRSRNLKNQKDYWLYGGGRGQEKAAFAAEVRENLLQRGILKNRYDEITPKMLEDHFKLYHNTKAGKYNLRLYDIMTNDKNNFNLLSKALNKMPSLVPYLGAGYLGYEGLKSMEGSNIQEYKQGGIVLDLSEDEIEQYQTVKGKMASSPFIPKKKRGGLLMKKYQEGGIPGVDPTQNFNQPAAAPTESYNQLYEQYINQKAAYDAEMARIQGLTSTLLSNAEKKDQGNIPTRTDLGWIDQGKFFCNSHTCELLGDSGYTIPGNEPVQIDSRRTLNPGDKIPLIPGNMQMKGNMTNMGFVPISQEDWQPGDIVQEELFKNSDYQGNSFNDTWVPSHSSIYAGQQNGEPVYYNAPDGSRDNYVKTPVSGGGIEGQDWRMQGYRYVGDSPRLKAEMEATQAKLDRAPIDKIPVTPIQQISMPGDNRQIQGLSREQLYNQETSRIENSDISNRKKKKALEQLDANFAAGEQYANVISNSNNQTANLKYGGWINNADWFDSHGRYHDNPATGAAASSNEYKQGGEIIPDNVKKMKAALDKELEAVKNYNLTPAKKNKLIQELYAVYNENVPPKFKLGGPVLSTELQMYKDYIMGKNESPEALKNYDKLNRVHYKKAKANNMAPSNYIMTELIS
jgi:hypothetical protein